MVILLLKAPPNNAPVVPFKYIVPLALFPMRILNVVELAVPATILWVREEEYTVAALSFLITVDAKALAVESWNKLITTIPVPLCDQLEWAVIMSILLALSGSIARVINSTPSVF